MQYTRVARGKRDKTYGYEVTYPGRGRSTFTLFWSRDQIDFQDRSPKKYRLTTMKFGDGRLWYPDRITTKSLPGVHRAIRVIERDYARQANGAIAAAEKFGDVASLGAAAPISRARPPRAPRRKPRTTRPRTKKPSPSRASRGCFVAGTVVHTPSGTVAIEHLEPGDRVHARDESTGDVGHQPVAATFIRHDVELIEVTVARDDDTSEIFVTTAEHPWWVDSRGWVQVAELAVGDALQAIDGRALRVADVRRTGRRATVYNLEVDGFHTYFVGESGVWVHNKPMSTRGIRISRKWRARKITDPACEKGCEGVARQIHKHIGGEVYRIKANPSLTKYIGRYRGHNVKWFYHDVVVKNGRVYDAFTGHKGLPIAEYKKLWQFGDGLIFGF